MQHRAVTPSQIYASRSIALYRRSMIIAGLILLVIGGYSLYTSRAYHPYQSTFNILPGKFLKILANLRDGTLITGNFQETSGRNVTFQIMSSAQFATFQTGGNIGSLYSLQNMASGSISYTTTALDTYYLVFTHGLGLLATTETVNFQRAYISPDEFLIVSGVVLVGLGAVQLFLGLRLRGSRLVSYPSAPKV